MGKLNGAKLESGEWKIPETSIMPKRTNEKLNKNYLLERLREEKDNKFKGGIYHKLQVLMTYNSNHIEGSKLSEEQTRYIFETRTLGISDDQVVNVDDVIETVNHFECFDRVIDFANYPLSEHFMKELHFILKSGTSDSGLPWFAVGDYKKRPNIVGDRETISPSLVRNKMKELMGNYNKKKKHSFEEIVEFHSKFESIHPFQDGNGRVGRLIALKECLANNIVPFIITDEIKYFYYRGLSEYENEPGYLIDTCKSGQDLIIKILDYFNIKH